MPNVDFSQIKLGSRHTRKELAGLWRYDSYHAIARGVVTPSGDNKIVLFVTERKKSDREQYEDRLLGKRLQWEGPTDHFAESRMVDAPTTGDELHVFYRYLPNDRFAYLGRARTVKYEPRSNGPSRFVFEVQMGSDDL